MLILKFKGTNHFGTLKIFSISYYKIIYEKYNIVKLLKILKLCSEVYHIIFVIISFRWFNIDDMLMKFTYLKIYAHL